jgi:DNA primase small subunit
MNNGRKSEKDIAVVRAAFKEYYFKYSNLIDVPTRTETREFGYMLFASGLIRHLSYRNIRELHAILIREVPSDVFCSSAYYIFPTYSMTDKQWKGADLIFDIDGKDLNLPCEESHSYSICSSCSMASSMRTQACVVCNSTKVIIESIPCDKCMHSLKKEVYKLMGLLISDLGVSKNSIKIYFSGNNGFHVHISDSSFEPLDSTARSEITRYLMGQGVLTDVVGVRKLPSGNFNIKIPRGAFLFGWRKRLADSLRINQSSTSKLRNIVQESGGYDMFKDRLNKLAKDMGAKIDPVVTTDVHRIFRLGGTLNGKSGLTKVLCSDLGSFDPLADGCLLGDKDVDVSLTVPHIKLRLKGRVFDLANQKATLPLYAAVYLICKGLARTLD